MGLYEILSNRACINVLKALYDVEYVLKTGHSMKLPDIEKTCGFQLKGSYAVAILRDEGLLTLEVVEEMPFASLTSKGKTFIEQVDELKNILDGKEESPQATIKIEYQLTNLEKKILVLVHRMKQETGQPISLKNLTLEVYPSKDPSNKTGAISKYVSRLEELNLLEKITDGRRIFVDITESGTRYAEQQISF